MQSCLIFHKTLKKANRKSENFKVLVDLTDFLQLRKLWNEGEDKFILLLSFFLFVHKTFQYKLKYHTGFLS